MVKEILYIPIPLFYFLIFFSTKLCVTIKNHGTGFGGLLYYRIITFILLILSVLYQEPEERPFFPPVIPLSWTLAIEKNLEQRERERDKMEDVLASFR